MLLTAVGAALAAADQPPVDANPVSIGPGAVLVTAVSLVCSFGTVFGLLAGARRWVNTAIKTSDGRSVVAVLEANSATLTDMASRIEQLADDVRELRSGHSSIVERVTRLEQYVIPQPGQRGRGGGGWFRVG